MKADLPSGIRRKGDRFQAYARVDGAKVYVGTFDSVRDAVRAQSRHVTTQDMIAAGELPPEVDAKRTLREAVAEWLAALKAGKSRSHDAYEYRMKSYVLPSLGDLPINRITKSTIAKWRDEQSALYSPASVNGSLTCLSSAFTYFVQREWTSRQPCREVKLVTQNERAYEWIRTKEEITKLLLACPTGIREIATVAVGTGLRLDEVLHLRWADVDLERRLIAVHRGRQGTTKSGRMRHVPILDSVLPFLRELALKRGGAVMVFPAQPQAGRPHYETKPRSKPGVTRPFKEAVRRVGLPNALRFHDLRHTFASHWVLDGGDIFRLSRILGHANVAMTQKVYAHLAPDAWQQDYHRVSFVAPNDGDVHYFVRRGRPPGETREKPPQLDGKLAG